MITASSLRLTADATIHCRYFLGADCRNGSLNVDRGNQQDGNRRLLSLATPGKYSPDFPIVSDDESSLTDLSQVSSIHCYGTFNDVTIFYSET
jgi:hypothetical protein